MSSLSIRNMNWTLGQRELQSDNNKAEVIEICRKIADALGDEGYAEWWNNAPDNNADFLKHARQTLEDLEAFYITAWLGDPRTAEQIAQDADWQDWQQTRESVFPY